MMLINGAPATMLDARDRGLHYGDGLFETLAIRAQRPRQWERHIARLLRGCERLGLPIPEVARLQQEALQVCAGTEDGVLKIIWTRGPGGRGYAPGDATTPTRIVAAYPAPQYPRSHYETGVTTRWCQHRLGLNPALAGIKHLNRLDQVLARAEWRQPDIAEGFMCDIDGNLISGTMSNLFLVRHQQLSTPDLSRCGITGIARERIIELARLHDIPCAVTSVTPDDLCAADEVFLCNSVIGVWPVRALDERQWPVGTVTRLLSRELDRN